MNKKRLFIIISPIILFFVIILIISAIFLIIQSKKPSQTDVGTIEHQNIAIFENRYQLDYSIGEENASRTFDNINKIITDQNEIDSAPNKITPNNNSNTYYTSTLEETSFKLLSQNNGYTYSFNLDINDGRHYQVTIKTDPSYGSEYIIILIKQLNDDNSYIIIDSDSLTLTDEIKTWAESLGFTNLTNYSS